MAVVVEVAEPEPGALRVLDHEVGALDRAVRQAGEVPAQQLGFPPRDRRGEAGELGDFGVGGVLVEAHEASAGVHRVAGVVDGAEQFLGEVGGGDFAVGVAAVEPGQHPVEAAVGETLVAAQQAASDAVERVVAVASMAEGVLLDSAADLVEGLVGEADQVEVVHDDRRVREPAAHRSGIRLVGVDHDMVDPVTPHLGFGREPVSDSGARAALEHVDRVARVEVHDVGDELGRRCRRGCQEAGLVKADRPGCAERGHMRRASTGVVANGVHGRPPRHAQLRSQRGHRLAARTDPAGDVGAGAFGEHGSFVDLVAGIDESTHGAVGVGAAPQLLAPDGTGTPEIGRSRTTWQRVSCRHARRPQAGQPTGPSGRRSIHSVHCPPSFQPLVTTNSSRPTSAVVSLR